MGDVDKIDIVEEKNILWSPSLLLLVTKANVDSVGWNDILCLCQSLIILI